MRKTIIITLLFLPFLAYAAIPAPITKVADLKSKVLCGVAYWLFVAAIALSIICVLIAAFRYLTSSGDSEKVSVAHRSLIYAAVGVAVAIIAGGFPYIIGGFFGSKVNLGSSICSAPTDPGYKCPPNEPLCM